MDVYNYVASNNPSKAQDIINSFGYNVVDKNDMGGNLKRLVAEQGEPALKMILENHPDKEIILEIFNTESETKDTSLEKKIIDKFLNANGNETTEAKKVENNFSLVFLAGILVLSFAIMSKK